MWGTTILLALALGQSPKTDPADLVARLGSARYADREAATAALEELGREALPALRNARDLRDPEIRTRASALITRIEGALLTQPSRIRLDFDDAPLTEVVKALTDQTGVKVTLVPDNSPNWKTRKVTLRESEPLTFWKAIDRLCESANLQYNHGMQGFGNGREPTFSLFDGSMQPSNPVFDSGPFRVIVVQLHHQRDLNFPPGPRAPGGARPANRALTEQLYASLQVTAEPRLSISQNGQVKIQEALDEKGQILANPSPPITGMASRAQGFYGFNAGSTITFQVPLNRPAQAGETIRSLKGSVPVVVATRKPNPLEAAIAGAAGKTFTNEDASIVVHEVRLMPNTRQSSIELTVRTSNTANPDATNNDFRGGFARMETSQQHIEIVDAQGRLIPWFQSNFDNESGRFTLTTTSPEPPQKIRYYSLVRAAAEVPFEFGDLPLP